MIPERRLITQIRYHRQPSDRRINSYRMINEPKRRKYVCYGVEGEKHDSTLMG